MPADLQGCHFVGFHTYVKTGPRKNSMVVYLWKIYLSLSKHSRSRGDSRARKKNHHISGGAVEADCCVGRNKMCQESRIALCWLRECAKSLFFWSALRSDVVGIVL